MTLSNCPVCSGLLLPDEDEDLRCVNCGRRFYQGQPSNDQGETGKDCKAWEEPEPSEEPIPEPRPEGSPLADKPSPSLTLRVCQDCKEDISGRAWNCVRCLQCQKAADQAVMAQSNRELHRRRQEKFGTNLVKCPVCGKKFAPGRSMQTHQRRSHSDSSTPTKWEARSCQNCGTDISDDSPGARRCLACQAEEAAEPESEPVLPEYTPTAVDKLVEDLLKERSFGGKGYTISGANIALAYIDAMIIVTEVTQQETQKDLAALCRVRELLGDNQDEEQTQPATVASDT